MTKILLEMLSYYGNSPVEVDDSWASASLNYVCKKLGYARSGEMTPQSWLKLPIIVLHPSVGDIVVFNNHVGLFISWDTNLVWNLCGTRSGVSILPYPRERLLGIRRL